MNRTLLIVVVLLLATPVLAQGPFNDVPTDHWAYDAVNTLQKDGIVIGYPDGTFGGKRAMSRYEFATAIARILPLLDQDLSRYATKDELRQAIAGIKIPEIPDLSKFATKEDVDALRRLIDEFRDTLAQLGVDVDALKRDVCALAARVDALEAEMKRVRWSGDVNVFAISTNTTEGFPFDLDERLTTGIPPDGPNPSPAEKDTLIRNITVVRDFDLNVVGRVAQTTTAVATINYGNYLQYLGFIDDYVDDSRPYDLEEFEEFQEVDVGDMFFPYYMYINSGFCRGSVTVGRMPLQFTPYTLKKIDVDSYTTILKTDDGNYPVDGIKFAYNFGGVDLTLFAVRNDLNSLLLNGFTGQPRAGLYNNNDFVFANDGFIFQTTPELIGNHVVGNLPQVITQSAGGRLSIGTPWKGALGLTYYQAWSENEWSEADPTYDRARVYGADLNIPFGNWGVNASWTQSDALVSERTPFVLTDADDDNTAWDAAISGAFGRLGIIAGYKMIDRNFASAGAWDKIGRWTNPVAIKGPYLDFSFPIARKLRLALNGEFLTMTDDVRGFNPLTLSPNFGWGAEDDTIIKAQAGLQWGISRSNSLDLGYDWIRFCPDNSGLDDATETYLTVGWAHQFSPNAGFKIGYQFINYDDGAPFAINGTPQPGPGPYVGDYEGGVGVVQVGVTF